jgi:glycosyltransferase involved in cell wall biosynthesis
MGRDKLRIRAIKRDWHDARLHTLLNYLQTDADVSELAADLNWLSKLFLRGRYFSMNRERWRERTKKNAHFFRCSSDLIARRLDAHQSEGYDVLFLFEALYSPGIGSSLRTPYVIYEDTTTLLANRLWPRWVPDSYLKEDCFSLEKEVYLNASFILTTNDRARESLISDYGALPEKVITVYQGSNLTFTKDEEGSSKKGSQIIFVGYEFERKGGEILLQAFSRVRKEVPEAKLVLVGPRKHIACDGVICAGRIRDPEALKKLFLSSSIFALPAWFDPMPCASLEAMGAKLAVVASDRCGTSELIENGKNGFIVGAGDVGQLSDKLIFLLKNPDLASEMGENASRLVRQRLSWNTVSQNVLRFLQMAANA